MAAPDPQVVERQMYLDMLGIAVDDPDIPLSELKKSTGGGVNAALAAIATLNGEVNPFVAQVINDHVFNQVNTPGTRAYNKIVEMVGDATQLWARSVLPNGTDINTIRDPGLYVVKDVAAAGTMINWPTNRAGTLLVGKNADASATTQDVIAYVSTTAPVERYSRATLSSTSTAWSPWTTVEWAKGVIPATSTANVNVDTFRSPGAWAIPTANLPYITGLPAGATSGYLEVFVSPGTALAFQRYTQRVTNSSVKIWQRFTLLSGGWAGVAWEQTNAPQAGSGSNARMVTSDHATRLEYARARRGGSIGTGGKAVVMLRFDHWLVAFRDVVLPILEANQLPATLNVNYDNMNIAANGNGSIPWSTVQDWNQYKGIEIANHGSTHTDASTEAAIWHEVAEGQMNLENAMPRVAVDTWHEHGSAYMAANDILNDPGLNLGRTIDSFTESWAGKLVMAYHAVVEGKCGGFFVPLTGNPVVGQSHYSIDQSTDVEAKGQVDNAKALGRGITLYIHPGLLNTVLVNGSIWPATYQVGGAVSVTNPDNGQITNFGNEADFQTWATTNGHTIYMRTSYFQSLCEYLAAERAAGNIMVMTSAGGAFADKSHSRRENLFAKADFTTGYGAWWSSTGWTINNPGAAVTLTADASTRTLSQTMLLHSRNGWAMGATHEILVKAKAATPTTLTLRAEKVGDAATWSTERVFNIPGDNVEREYRLNLSLPRDSNAGITQIAPKIIGSNLTIVGPPIFAAI